ncbi:sensor histidine kinase [Bacillus sp. FJAT-50079]|uniref:sensor histidine kinase n=1 Tax=Bacillus sp. FJAT-50079 TaxID=2833577 RepID=UPI001BC913A5|nr:sensor histidine kinase [Bacillus sp. FJAT-50079]MBS4206551.1 sensor histidine kinase [Bacillus sp. FJAT-50079]
MKGWIIRLVVFATIWICFLVENIEDDLTFSLLLIGCAISFAMYFFLPVMKNPVWLYVFLHSLHFSLLFLKVDFAWIWLFVLYITMEAVFQLRARAYRFFVAYSFILIVLLCILKQEWQLTFLFITCFFLFLALRLHQYVGEREEQREMYEHLLTEYRNVKRLNLENERVARLEERTRIARDMHDSVGHKLTALLMQVEMLSIQNRSTDYADLKQLALQSLEETRMAVKTLKHEEVAGIASVLQLIRKLEAENHLLVRFTTKQGVLMTELTNVQSVVLYRSIQEGLTNVMKHSPSKKVEVTLGRSAIGDIEWVIANPISHPNSFEIGFGLTAMRERVEEQGGRLRIYQTDQEFIIEGSMPVKEKAS